MRVTAGKSNIRVTQGGGGDNHRLHHLCDFVCAGNEHDCEVGGAKVAGPSDSISPQLGLSWMT